MKRQLLSMVTMAMIALSGMAQETQKTDFKPSGKFDGRIFGSYYSSIGAEEHTSGFSIDRAYLGYTHNLTEEFSGRILLDIDNEMYVLDKDTSLTNTKRNAFFKNAAVFYKKEAIRVGFGIQNTFSMTVQEKVWGKRYIMKTFQDEYKFSNTADLGASFEYTADMFSFDVAVFNGEGFAKIQKDDANMVSLGATLKLLDQKLYLRASDEFMDNGIARNSVALFAGYLVDKFSAGFEYNMQSNYSNKDGLDRDGISAYGAYNVNEKWSIFGRFDNLSSNTIQSSDQTMLTGGVEFKPAKGIATAFSLRDRNFEKDGIDNQTFAYFNIDFKF